MRRFVLFAFAVSALGQQCVIPGNVPSTRPTKVDYKNKDIAVDYHGLAISWSPQFCNSPAGQIPRNS